MHSGDSSVFGEIRVYSAKDRVYSASIRVYSAEHFLKFETHSSVFGGIRVYSAGECIRRNGRVYSARTQPFTAHGASIMAYRDRVYSAKWAKVCSTFPNIHNIHNAYNANNVHNIHNIHNIRNIHSITIIRY